MSVLNMSASTEWSQTSHSCAEKKETDAPKVENSLKLVVGNILCEDTKRDNILHELGRKT